MQRIYLYILLLALGASWVACSDEAKITVLPHVSFPGTVSLSTHQVVLSAENLPDKVLSLQWAAVKFAVPAPVQYSLQISTVDDSTMWQHAVEIALGADILSKQFTGQELNLLATERLSLPEGTATQLAVRVKSYVNRAVYSPAVSFSVVPYKAPVVLASLWVPGDYQGWNPATAPRLVSIANDGIYEGYIYIPDGGSFEIKLTAQPAWEPMAYGSDEEGVLKEANYAGSNLKVPEAGYYLLAVDLNTMRYLLLKTTWGIIGGATPKGWDASTALSYNPDSQTWSVTCAMKADGSFKFRANDAWQLDFGIDAQAKLAYANHPWRPYVDQPQLTVPQDGNYTIVLDLHDPAQYRYSLLKQ